MEARLEHFFHVVVTGLQRAVFEKEVRRLEVLFDEILQRQKVLAVAFRHKSNAMKFFAQVFYFLLRLRERVDLVHLLEVAVEVFSEAALVKHWHRCLVTLQPHRVHLIAGFTIRCSP